MEESLGYYNANLQRSENWIIISSVELISKVWFHKISTPSPSSPPPSMGVGGEEVWLFSGIAE